MNFIPTDWAMKHAPVADAVERVILTNVAESGDGAGCDCYRSHDMLARLACVTPEIIRQKFRDLEQRGILRVHSDKSWELMIPADFFSAGQLDDINDQRIRSGQPPIDPQNRPRL